MPPSRDSSFGPRKLMSIDKVRVSVEEVQGSRAPGVPGRNVQDNGEPDGKRRGGGRFDFEADDVSVQQVRFEGYPVKRIPNLACFIDTTKCIEML